MLEGIWLDLRLAVRGLARRPAFTIVSVLILAVGIGANTALISAVDAVMLGVLPYPDADRIVSIFSNNRDEGMERMVAALPIARDWQRLSDTLEEIGLVWSPASMTLSGREEPLRLQAGVVSPSYFSIVGATAQLGRLFGPEDDRIQGEHAVVILSDALWRGRFGAAPEVLGEAVVLDGMPYTVAGVLARGAVHLPRPAQEIDVWVPAMMGSVVLGADVANTRTTRIFAALGRLRAGVTLPRAQEEMDVVAEQLAAAWPLSDGGWGVELVPIRDLVLGPFETPLLALLGGAALLLAVGCANVASLLLVRTSGRRRELATRMALGASRGRVARLLVVEVLVLVAAGGLIGIQAATLGAGAVVHLSPIELPAFAEPSADAGVLLAAFGVTLLVGLAAALGSVALLRGGSPVDSLGGSGKGSSLGGAGRIGSALTVIEVAIAVTLLAGAGITVRSLGRLQGVDVGYDPDNFLALQLEASSEGLDDAELREMAGRLAAETGALASVDEAYVWSPMVPGESFWYTSVRPQDRPNLRDDELPLVRFHYVGPGALEGLGLRFLAGRGISTQDREDGAGAVVLSASAAEALWPGRPAIGKVLRRWNRQRWLTVVGVVQDALQSGRQGSESDVNRDVYFSYVQEPQRQIVLLARAEADAAAIANEVSQTVRRVAPDFPAFDIETLASRMSTQDALPRLTAQLAVGYAAASLLLATIGLYGVLAYGVSQRAGEIGLRMALGADRARVLAHVLRRGLVLTGLGLGVGLASSIALTRLIASLLYETSPTDPVIFTATGILLLLTATLASAVPARRAAKLDPASALRGR